ncbi:MAG: DUF2891 domain-containing protein, partial [Bacteroidia bacterium]|nr:DUF2891 domain-containing protein [Bacteroidia bacterium]
LSKEEDLGMPVEHHPAFYGCFDWHSAVHGHWSLIFLMKQFPDLDSFEVAINMLDENLTKANIEKELAYFSMNRYTKSFERTYGWAWLLKLAEELYTWDHPMGKKWFANLKPLTDHISQQYIEYLPKLVYPIRVGEHSNTAFGLSFAFDYAKTTGDTALLTSIKENALRFYQSDSDCPIHWEPSGYDFLSPCLQEMDIMRKVLDDSEFDRWLQEFLPRASQADFELEPGKILDRTDGKLVHLDGLNFSRAWCLYPIEHSASSNALKIADQHMQFSLDKIRDGDYSGEHWLASFALYAYKSKLESE